FFFQAEDGIRDLTVTGVQTCALPISAVWLALADPFPDRASASHTADNARRIARFAQLAARASGDTIQRASGRRKARVAVAGRGRSEERRVGKEGRCRWGQ